MLLHLSIVRGCLSVSPTMAEQSDRELYHLQSLKYLLSGPVLKGRDHVPYFHVRQCLAQGEFQTEVLVLLPGPAGATRASSTGKPPASHTPIVQLAFYPFSCLSFFTGETGGFTNLLDYQNYVGEVFKVEMPRPNPRLPISGSAGMGL